MAELPRLLVIDDGEAYARVVREQIPEVQLLAPAGSRAGRMPDGPSALKFLAKEHAQVDLVLLDVSFDLPQELLLPLAGESSPRRVRRYQGVAILREIRLRWPQLPVLLLTAERDLSLVDADGQLAAQSMTYVLGGDDLDALRIGIHTALAASREEPEEGDVLWGRDAQMSALRRRLLVLARGSLPVIVEGETGTGKSYLAEHYLHRHSERPGPFVVVDLSTVPRDLVAARLFGAMRGAYTGAIADQKGLFEQAHRGTLFLDEIQNTPLELQKQLLVVLQERRVRPLGAAREIAVDVKLIAGSGLPLAQAVAEQRFRADLYMRLSPATRVRIPPLRERRADLRFFCERFAERASADPDLKRMQGQLAKALGLSQRAPLRLCIESAGEPDSAESVPAESALQLALPGAAWQLLCAHAWPGNLRELSMLMHNVIAFTLVRATDALASGVPLRSPRLQIDPGLVGELLAASAQSAAVPSVQSAVDPGAQAAYGPTAVGDGDPRLQPILLSPASSLNLVARDVERQYLHGLFQRTGGDFARMAELLLGDRGRTRAVRLRFNQLGLKIRGLRRS